MKNIIKHLAAILIVITLSACAYNQHSVLGQYGELALQEMQTEDFEANQRVAFSSVLSVLQDFGYIVDVADGDTGLITATSPSVNNTNIKIFGGINIISYQTKLSAIVEPTGINISKIRLNIVTNTTSGGGAYSEYEAVLDPAVYNEVFERVAETIFVRQSLSE